jgi:hypothetical protein
MKEKFLQAIDNKFKLKVTFNAKEKGEIVRVCIPFDFGPSQKADTIDKFEKYHMYDLDSQDGPHTLSLNLDQVMGIEILNENFDPAEYITWQPKWIYKRDWGMQS